jgi:LacI family transcriptional regulator
MREAGLQPHVICHKRDEEFPPELRALLKAEEAPTAIFAYNETLALCCTRAMMDLGLRFADLSLAGVTWTNERAMEIMGITCVHLPARQLGRQAFEMLLRKLVTGQSEAAVLLRGSLHPGASTSRCAGG